MGKRGGKRVSLAWATDWRFCLFSGPDSRSLVEAVVAEVGNARTQAGKISSGPTRSWSATTMSRVSFPTRRERSFGLSCEKNSRIASVLRVHEGTSNTLICSCALRLEDADDRADCGLVTDMRLLSSSASRTFTFPKSPPLSTRANLSSPHVPFRGIPTSSRGR